MTLTKLKKLIALLLWIPITLLYYNNNFAVYYASSSSTDLKTFHNNNKDIQFKSTYKGTEKYLINTQGCYIPNYGRTFKFEETKFLNKSCGVRAVFIKRIGNNNIHLSIDKEQMRIYSKGKTYQCCVSFAAPQNTSGKNDLETLEYSSCTAFQNGSKIELEQEIVTVSCHSKSVAIYKDAYIILKKLVASKDQENSKNNSWNILLLGMDTMSRARLLSSMPLTAQYLRKLDWLDFRGYQKVGYNTFPNLISLMSGKNVSSMYKACANGLNNCNKLLLWTKFKEAGYRTAYGEEFLRLPDTFSRYGGFETAPTDHYMRPFFLTGENDAGNFLCTKKMTSAFHILDYAYQFSEVYRKSKAFGFFWINSCSHNLNNNPTLFDQDFLNFFDKMYNNGIMDKTFIIFLSDHGIRYGKMRVPMESYYEERLPMCYVWVPKEFRELFPKQYMNLQINQEKLVTPYDMYMTIVEILKINEGSNKITKSEACPLCKSLFNEISPSRGCRDAGVDEKWCTCHNMTVVDKNKNDVIRSLELITETLDEKTTNIKTKKCTQCYKFTLKTILRSHSYKNPGQNTTYYVIAFLVDPGSISYEVVLEKQNDEFRIISLETISTYNRDGFCVENPNDRGFCVCENTCKVKVKTKKKRRETIS